MNQYLFLDKSIKPTVAQLKSVLAASYKYWSEILKKINSTHEKVFLEWKFYSSKTGWTGKALLNKRNLFFFRPFNNYFTLTFVFGDKAVNEIERSDVSEELKKELLSARKFAEGRTLPVFVTKKSDLKNIYKLIEIKVNN